MERLAEKESNLDTRILGIARLESKLHEALTAQTQKISDDEVHQREKAVVDREQRLMAQEQVSTASFGTECREGSASPVDLVRSCNWRAIASQNETNT